MRTKEISDEVLLGMFESYLAEECEGNESKVSLPEFGAYVRGKGYHVQDYTIRRSKPVSDRIKACKGKNRSQNIVAAEVAFIPLDVEAFIEKNNSAAKMKSALSNRDQYYNSMSDRCMYILKRDQQLVKKMDVMADELREQKKYVESLETKLSEKTSETTRLKARLKYLTDYIKDNVYPAIANELLIEDNDAVAIGDKESVLKDGAVKESIFTGTEKETPFGKDNIIQGLFDDFYSEEDT